MNIYLKNGQKIEISKQLALDIVKGIEKGAGATFQCVWLGDQLGIFVKTEEIVAIL